MCVALLKEPSTNAYVLFSPDDFIPVIAFSPAIIFSPLINFFCLFYRLKGFIHCSLISVNHCFAIIPVQIYPGTFPFLLHSILMPCFISPITLFDKIPVISHSLVRQILPSGVPSLSYGTLIDEHHSVGHFSGKAHLMCHDYHCHACLCKLLHY